ncbi:MAG TPA: hypothetical protein VG323_19750 [Thermoanaerobaculia bacterium]|nr:hypothetical protein [Thermoanaerobaculia bacterium]
MTLLIDGVHEVEPAQERIAGQLRGAEQIAAAVGLGLAEAEKFLHAPLGIAPDPMMNGRQQAIDCRRMRAARSGRK